MIASISDMNNGKFFGTFKFQFSKYSPVHPEPGIVPKNKVDAENFIAMCYCQFLTRHFNSKISSFKLNENDSNKNPDIIIVENDIIKGIQISQLQFTNYEGRKAIAKKKNFDLANEIAKYIKIDFPLNINILPVTTKDLIPLLDVKKGKTKIEFSLVNYITKSIKDNITKLLSEEKPVWIKVADPKLSIHFSMVVLNPIPKDSFSRFPGKDNIFVNYDFNDVAYDLSDIEIAIDKMYIKKDKGNSDILLLWMDDFGLHDNMKHIASTLFQKFFNSTFKEIYILTFTNNKALFLDSLQLWPIKTNKIFPQKL